MEIGSQYLILRQYCKPTATSSLWQTIVSKMTRTNFRLHYLKRNRQVKTAKIWSLVSKYCNQMMFSDGKKVSQRRKTSIHFTVENMYQAQPHKRFCDSYNISTYALAWLRPKCYKLHATLHEAPSLITFSAVHFLTF